MAKKANTLPPVRPLPVRTVIDWQAVADDVIANGPWLAPADTNNNAAHAVLHRRGLSLYQVRAPGGGLIGYSIERKR